jgi:hypothetical protein
MLRLGEIYAERTLLHFRSVKGAGTLSAVRSVCL